MSGHVVAALSLYASIGVLWVSFLLFTLEANGTDARTLGGVPSWIPFLVHGVAWLVSMPVAGVALVLSLARLTGQRKRVEGKLRPTRWFWLAAPTRILAHFLVPAGWLWLAVVR